MKSDQQPGFVFYFSWTEYFADFEEKERLEVFEAIVYFAKNNSLPENLSRDAKLILRSICGDITRNQEKRAKILEIRKNIGKLGGRPRKQQESQKPNDSEENQKNQKVIPETKKTYEVEVEEEVVVGVEENNKKNNNKKKELTKFGQRIAMTAEEHAKLCEEFGKAETQEALATADDWLLSKGKVQKDYAAFMRNWLRRNAARNRIDMRRSAPKQIAPIDYENSVARLRAEGFDVIEA